MGTLQFFRERFVFLGSAGRTRRSGRQLHQHEELRARLARAQHEAAQGAQGAGEGLRGGSTRRACQRELAELEAAVIHHFRCEEADDPLAEVVRVAPRYFEHARVLQAQHGTLEREITAIRELAEVCGRSRERWSELEWRLGTFARRLQAHERAENEIASQVLYEDIGTKD